MGLLDVLNGLQHGPRGRSDPNASSGGMSPITMAILSLLAYQGYKSFTGGQSAVGTTSPGAAPGSRTVIAGRPKNSGDLGDLLGGSLGGLLTRGAAGSVLSGGLNDLLKHFQQSGYGDTASSWVGAGPNKNISPDDLASALGADRIGALVSQCGMSRDELLQGLSQYLPQVVDQLTPQGRVPTEQEASQLI
jgi:uncharacterized protein YidB (DUF937 family)